MQEEKIENIEKEKKEDRDKKKKRILIAIILITSIIILIVCGVIYLVLKGNEKGKEKDEGGEQEQEEIEEEEKEEETETEEDVEDDIPAYLEGKIIYVKDNNIYIADKYGKSSSKLTDYSEESIDNIRDLHLTVEDKLGFSRCEVTTGDFGCKIYLLDIETKEVRVLKRLGKDMLISQVAIINEEKYAYSTNSTIYLYEDGNHKELVNFEVPNLGGRGGVLGDSSRLEFSPDQTKLLHIDTGATRKDGENISEFVIYVFDLEGKQLDKVEDATQPVWKDDTTIVYRTLVGGEDTNELLFERDIIKGKSTLLKSACPPLYDKNGVSIPYDGPYDPLVLGDRLIYWGIYSEAFNYGKSYIYDISEDKRTELAGNIAYVIWLSESEIIYAKTVEPSGAQSSYEILTNFEVEGYYVRDLDTGKDTKIDIEVSVLRMGIVTWYNKLQEISW